MKIKSKPFFIAVSIGLILWLILFSVPLIIFNQLNMMQDEQLLDGFYSIFAQIFNLILFIAGVLYTYYSYKQATSEKVFELKEGIIGGALAALTVRFLVGILAWVTLVIPVILYDDISSSLLARSMLIGTEISRIGSMIVGGFGGGLYATILER